jgi:hypothetical protein
VKHTSYKVQKRGKARFLYRLPGTPVQKTFRYYNAGRSVMMILIAPYLLVVLSSDASPRIPLNFHYTGLFSENQRFTA